MDSDEKLKIQKAIDDLQKGRTDSPDDPIKDDNSKQQNKPRLTPEEQELAYELKAQLMKNVEVQTSKLKTELALHEKFKEVKLLNKENKRLNDECSLSRTNLLKLMKMFERKANEADKKLKEMQTELSKSRELAKKYQKLYEDESLGRGDGNIEPSPATDNQRPKSSAAIVNSHRVGDVIRRNECLVQENGDLTREVQRLKRDNADLLKKAKRSMSDRESLLLNLHTSESSRQELIKRLHKEKQKHQSLNRSLTRQAADWIEAKKQFHEFEEAYRWDQVGSVSPCGAEPRFYVHPAAKNLYQPRKMYPAEQWATQLQGKG